jgi:hypothetical protein
VANQVVHVQALHGDHDGVRDLIVEAREQGVRVTSTAAMVCPLATDSSTINIESISDSSPAA